MDSVYNCRIRYYPQNGSGSKNCDIALKKLFTNDRRSVGFYPVSDEECDEMPDDTVFYYI